MLIKHRAHSSFPYKKIIFFFMCLFAFFAFAEMVLAHKVMIFAWIEGDTVYTQSKFSGGKRIKNSQIVVYDLKEKKLLEGKTDDKGEFSFKVPPKPWAGLKIVLNASMGHMAHWTIPVNEMGGDTHEVESTPASPPDGEFQPETLSNSESGVPSDLTPPIDERSMMDIGDCNCQNIQDMIDRSLDKKLTPITQILLNSLDPKPKLRDVIGGIGYIIGLVGLSLYFMARKKEK